MFSRVSILSTCGRLRSLRGKTRKSGMSFAAKQGKKYENVIRDILEGFGEKVLPTAGSSGRPDVTIVRGDSRVSFEAKSGNASEAGQQKIPLVNGHLEFKNEIMWEGRVPAFLKGDKTKETWLAEKMNFGTKYVPIEDRSIVSKYYKDKGSAYIQVQHKGLYHTGEDILNLGVPLFEADTKWRVRCKQHTGSSVPGSVMASLVFDRDSLKKSNKNLEWWQDNHL